MTNLSFEDVVASKSELFKGKKILVAFSGGKDSLALVDYLNCKKNDYGFLLGAAHVNHGLREESGSDEEFCRSWSRANNVPFFVALLDCGSASSAKNGLEDWCRRNRYAALFRICDDWGGDYILTAHTFDDKLESFFTDIYTGASIFTLGGISPMNGKVCRPMLEATSAHVEDYLTRRGLTPVFDKSNDDLRFVRNRMRHKVMPTLFSAGAEFVNTVLRLQEESAELNSFFYEKTGVALVENSADMVLVDKKKFLDFLPFERSYLLNRLFAEKFRSDKSLVKEALTLLSRNGSRRINLPDGFIFENSYNYLRIYKKSLIDLFLVEKDERIDTIDFLWGKVSFFDKLVEQKLVIRNRRHGDRWKDKKLKDVFINKKIDSFLRDTGVIVQSLDGEIIWAEGVSEEKWVLVERRY